MALKHPFCQCDDPGPDPGPIELDGDVTGPSDATVVVGIQGVPVEAGTPTDGQVLTFVEADGKARWATPGGGGAPLPLGGELAGTTDDAIVAKIGDLDVAFDDSASGPLYADAGAGEIRVVPGATGDLLAEVTVDVTDPPADAIYVVPDCKAARIFEIIAIVDEALDAEIELELGTTTGDDDLIVAQSVDENSSGPVAGHSVNHLGDKFQNAAEWYYWWAAKDDEIHVTVNEVGTPSQGKLRIRIYGEIIV